MTSLSQLRRGTVVYCVLALLENRERYATELVAELAGRDALGAGQGTIYPLLSRLRSEGLVETTWQESPFGPPRRYYRLASAGQGALWVFRGEWIRFRDALDGLLTTGPARRETS